jgi:spore coat protein H
LSRLIVESTDEVFRANIGQLINLNSVIDYYLFVNLCAGYDNVGKNWCFLKRFAHEPFILVPWDLDGTWGRGVKRQEISPLKVISNDFFKRLTALNPDDFNEKVTLRWNELRAEQFATERLKAIFDKNFEELRQYQIIPLERKLWHPTLNIDAEEVYMKNWIQERLVFLDEFFE